MTLPESRRDSGRLRWAGVGENQARSAKVMLARKLNQLIDTNCLSQTKAGAILGMPQPKVSAIRNYKLRGISLERLAQALVSLGQQVEIVVRPSSPTLPAGILVAPWHLASRSLGASGASANGAPRRRIPVGHE